MEGTERWLCEDPRDYRRVWRGPRTMVFTLLAGEETLGSSGICGYQVQGRDPKDVP